MKKSALIRMHFNITILILTSMKILINFVNEDLLKYKFIYVFIILFIYVLKFA